MRCLEVMFYTGWNYGRKKMMDKKFFNVVIAIVVFFSFFAVTANVSASQVSRPVLVGATVSLEGKYKVPSFMVRKAYELWARKINENGGLFGRPVKLLLKDDKSCPALAGELYEKLITEDHVDLVFAPYGSPLTMVASEVTEKYRKLMLACSASSEELWNRRFQYLIGMYATADRYFIGFLDLIARNGLNNVAIVFEDSTFTRGAASGAIKWAKRFGLNVLLALPYKSGKNSFGSIIASLKKTRPDAVILSAYPDDCYSFLKMMKLRNFHVRALCMTIAPVFPDFCGKAGEMCDGVFAPAQWVPNERIPYPGSREFIRDFKEFTGMVPTYHAASCYAACKIIEEAIRATGTLNQDILLRYILGLNTVSIIGRFRVSHLGKQIGHNPLTIQWQSGKQEIVYPINLQTALPRFKDIGQE